MVNEAPAVARPEREALEAILFNTKRDGPSRQNRERHPDFKAHLAGRIAWVAAANPRHAARLRELFDAIDWTR